MTSISSLFDTYGRQARLYPALITLLPAIGVAISIIPALATGAVSGVVVTLVASTGLIYLLSDFARAQGKRIEPALLGSWGGWPTTIWLRHSDGNLSALNRARYHAYLAAKITTLHIPTAAEEAADPAAADEAYASAVDWLKEQSRDDKSLVTKENANYGFRRNLLGLWWYGIAIATVCAVAELCIILKVFSTGPLTLAVALARVTSAPVLEIVALAASIALTLFWLLIVNATWVRAAGDAYAKILLATCDRPVA